jgi:signal transduction histidine kinase
MISGFLFLTFLILILAAVSLFMLDRTSHLADVHRNIGQLQIHTLLLFKNDNDFFDLEATNEKYFTTHQSLFLLKRFNLLQSVNHDIEKVLHDTNAERQAIDHNLLSIDSALKIYDQKFLQLEKLVFEKGLKDHGLEGKMRVHAHKLEDTGHMSITEILSLRRHEKDFFLRLDTSYVRLFRLRADALLSTMRQDEFINRFEIYHLQEYKRVFLELVQVHQQIGLTSSTGLRNELNKLTFLISNKYLDLAKYSYTLSSNAQQKTRIFYLILLVCAITFSIISGVWISRKLSEPIAQLSKQVRNVRDPATRIDYNLKKSAKEIQVLARAFNQLLEKSEQQMTEIKAKSKLLKKKNKQLNRLNKELDNFLYSTAHDLRSPLASLMGLINLFHYETERKHIDNYSNMMKESVIRMEDFIAQIVSYSKNKSMELSIDHIDMPRVISNIIESHKFMDQSGRIKWIIDIKEVVPVHTDLSRVTILLNNLISNALKYADLKKEEPFIRIHVRSDLDYIHIQFTDNGIGISQEHIERIFDMFYRADLNSKGSGLGLYILKQTIKRMKGFVQVESTWGVGSKFIITLPNQVLQVKNNESRLPLSLN